MYEYISGRVAEATPASIVIEAAGVGYYLNISLQTYAEVERLPEAKLWVHFVVREDAQILYGFATKDERELFRQLIGVSGVGPGTARMILSTYSPTELAGIINSENAVLLKNVKGLGLKTAEKIIIELRGKMTGIGAASAAGGFGGGADEGTLAEALAALGMLGFSRAASEKAVRGVMKDNPGMSIEEVIRGSLKKL